MSLTFSVLAAGLLAQGGLWLAVRYLTSQEILDRPNDRSSHIQPVPRGAGLAVIPAILIVWGAIAWDPAAWFGLEIVPGLGWIIIATLIISAISWTDDLRGLPPIVRLVVHALAITLVLWAVPFANPVFQGLLPAWADTVISGLLWLWFVNLFNFMDGIDGISGIESLAICCGIGVVFFLVPIGDAQLLMAGAIGSATFVFLWWNWHPAKIFLGDVGSIPLGFLLGWMLLLLATNGQWAAALILPAYYLADASVTLLRRIGRREKFWRAHRSHFYQQAANGGMSHAQISKYIGYANGGLIVSAAIATAGLPIPGIILTGVIVASLLWQFSRNSNYLPDDTA